MSRRLPVFFLLDVSESMAGDNLQKMEDGLGMIVRSLRQDPHALETVHISVVAFAGIARTIAPLMDLVSFYPPKLPIGSGTSLGAGLNALMAEIDRTVVRTTADRKGDWKPIVYLFTDGKPTDVADAAIERWQRTYARKAHLIAVGLGRYADLAVLRRLTETVLLFEDSREDDFAKFVKWVTASVTSQSRSVGDSESGAVPIAALDESILSLAKTPAAQSIIGDRDCVVIVGRCQRARKPYLMKFDRVSQQVETRDFALQANRYDLTGCHPIDESYFEWSAPARSNLTVNTSDLFGIPGCPYCGNPSAFAQCGCGNLMCVSGPGEAVCPWCEKTVNFYASTQEDEGFDVRRGRG